MTTSPLYTDRIIIVIIIIVIIIIIIIIVIYEYIQISLPDDLRDATVNSVQFRRNLKTYLFA